MKCDANIDLLGPDSELESMGEERCALIFLRVK